MSPERTKSQQELEAAHMGRYELIRPLGRGGMAEVFLARQPGLAGFSKQLVIKRVLPALLDDPKFVEMFLDEARLAARLTHPNICQVFELGEVNGQYYIAMEHVTGVTLTHLIMHGREKKLTMPVAAAFRIVAQLCEALAYAHQVSGDDGRPLYLVHRDVTPSNVMVTPEGSVKLLDFGIARAADRSHQTQIGVAKGKLGFMSPEQLKSPQDIDHKSDLFAVGAVLYTLLVGKTPYADVLKTSHGMRDMAHARFPPPREVAPWLPEPVEKLILRAMDVDPNQRFLSALEFHRELEKVAMSLSLSLGPHALLEYMNELEQDASERVTRKLKRSPDPVVKVDTGDVVPNTGESPRGARPPRALLPFVVLGAGVAVVVVGVALVLKLATLRPEENGHLPSGQVSPVPPADPQPTPTPKPEPPFNPTTVATPDPAAIAPPEPVVAPPEPTPTPAVVTNEPEVKPVVPPEEPRPRPTKKAPPVVGPSGTLVVEATPQARILIGGQLLGTTPLRVKVGVGSHRLKVDYGASAHQLIINVVEGRETTVRDQSD